MGIRSAFSPMSSGKKDPFKPETLIVSVSGGNEIQELFLPKGVYKIVLVGGGGGQGGFATNSGVAFCSGGAGSGAVIIFELVVLKDTIFEYCSGSVGISNRNYGTAGLAGGNSFLREKENPDCSIVCNSERTGSGGWNTSGDKGIIVDKNGFLNKYAQNIELSQDGNVGGGPALGYYNSGGAPVYEDYGRGAGPDSNNGTHGLVEVTYLRLK